MSAAEKLEALDGSMPQAEAPSADSPITTVRYALPEIIAVVKAAEIVRDAPSDYARVTLLQALSALDEALPDLGVATDSESPPLR